jgi:hypothetical protein
MRRTMYIALLAAVASLALFVVPASADHFEPGSSKTCGPLIAGQVNCTLTIAISDDGGPGVLEGDDIIVTLGAGTTGATYADADFVSGCGGGAVSVDSGTQLSIDPTVSPADDCTIVVTEVLNATASGEVCQTLDNVENTPPVTVCADILPGPEDPETDCKKGAWEDWGVFKNQGDCVSYIATNGRNAPAGA